MSIIISCLSFAARIIIVKYLIDLGLPHMWWLDYSLTPGAGRILSQDLTEHFLLPPQYLIRDKPCSLIWILALEPRSCKYNYLREMNIIPLHLLAEMVAALKEVWAAPYLEWNWGIASVAPLWGAMREQGRLGLGLWAPALSPAMWLAHQAWRPLCPQNMTLKFPVTCVKVTQSLEALARNKW